MKLWGRDFFFTLLYNDTKKKLVRGQLKCDGTHQKPDFVCLRNGRVHLNRGVGGGRKLQSTTGSWGVRISGINAGYTMFRGSVKVLTTLSIRQFPLHFPSRALPCTITFQLESTPHGSITKISVASILRPDFSNNRNSRLLCSWLYYFMILCWVVNVILSVEHKSRLRSGQMLKDGGTKILCRKSGASGWRGWYSNDDDEDNNNNNNNNNNYYYYYYYYYYWAAGQHVIIVIVIIFVASCFDFCESCVFVLCLLCFFCYWSPGCWICTLINKIIIIITIIKFFKMFEVNMTLHMSYEFKYLANLCFDLSRNSNLCWLSCCLCLFV